MTLAAFRIQRWCRSCGAANQAFASRRVDLAGQLHAAKRLCCLFPDLHVSIDEPWTLPSGDTMWVEIAGWLPEEGWSGSIVEDHEHHPQDLVALPQRLRRPSDDDEQC